MKPIKNKKTQKEIAKEWGLISRLRFEQIKSGRDLSYIHVLTPCILELTSKSNFGSVIDVGCGAGFLTNELSEKCKSIVGIDMCNESIDLAVRERKNNNIEFVKSTIEDFAYNIKKPKFTLAVSNMTLMTIVDLDNVLKSIYKLLVPEGHFVFTITHPCFWPLYWGYAFENWFDYMKEIAIEAPFKISLDDSSNLCTTHIHRPLEQYISSLLKNGFVLKNISEPFPNKNIEKKYPKRWLYPRFLGIKCVRVD